MKGARTMLPGHFVGTEEEAAFDCLADLYNARGELKRQKLLTFDEQQELWLLMSKVRERARQKFKNPRLSW